MAYVAVLRVLSDKLLPIDRVSPVERLVASRPHYYFFKKHYTSSILDVLLHFISYLKFPLFSMKKNQAVSFVALPSPPSPLPPPPSLPSQGCISRFTDVSNNNRKHAEASNCLVRRASSTKFFESSVTIEILCFEKIPHFIVSTFVIYFPFWNYPLFSDASIWLKLVRIAFKEASNTTIGRIFITFHDVL